MIVSFEQMLEKAKQGEPMVLAGAAAQDVDTIKAMAAAEKAGMIRPVLVGDIPTIERVMKEEGVTFRNAELVQADDGRSLRQGCRAGSPGQSRFPHEGPCGYQHLPQSHSQ